MKVSVLVPVCNGEAYLAECLESILAQEFDDMEILVADDASTDNSAALVESYASRDSRIRWWKNPGNLGLAQNWNGLLQAAKGEYIKYVHQDDKLISPLAIRNLAAMLDQHPEVSLVGSISQVLDGGSQVIEVRKCFEPGIMDGRRAIVRCLERLSNLIGEPSVVMFRRGQAARGYDEHLRHWLDLDLWFRLLEQGKFAHVGAPLSAFRRHAAQQSEINNRSGLAARENLALFRRWFDRLELEESVWRQALFARIYESRKHGGVEAASSIEGMMDALGRGWYAVFWCRRKITRPLLKLCGQTARRVSELEAAQRWGGIFRNLGRGRRADLQRETNREFPRRLLVIDAHPPTPERDGGSLRMFHLLQLLRQMDLQVAFVADNLQRNHCTEILESVGVETLWHPKISNVAGFLKTRAASYDYVILSRLAVAEKYVDLVKKYAPGTKVVFDTVDLCYLRSEREAEMKDDDNLKWLARACKKRELAVAQKADATLVVSPVEKQILGRECQGIRVEVVSNIHQTQLRGAGFSSRRDLLFIGGFSHAPNVDAVLFFVRDIFPLVERALPNVRFHVIGSNVPNEIARLANLKILVHGFVQDAGPFFDECKISVAPLRFGAGIKGKINQSQSHGVPVVATSLAVEGMQLEPGESVLVADTPGKFAEAIVSVYTNEALWDRLSRNGIKNLEEHFSFNSARTGLERLFNPVPTEARAWPPTASTPTPPVNIDL